MRSEGRRVRTNRGNEARLSVRPVVWLAFGAFLALHFVASFALAGRFWGAHHLRFLAPWGWAVWIVALAAVLFPRGRAGLADAARRADAFLAAKRTAAAALLFAVSWLVFFLFRTRNHFLGDGLLIASIVRNPEETGLGAAGFVSLAIHKGIYAAMRAVLPDIGGAAAFVGTSTLAGASVVLLARTASRALVSGGAERALLFASIVLSGGMLLFFGYVEYYPLMQAALLFYLVLTVRYLRGRGSLALPSAALLLAVLLHISAIAVVPSWLLLLGRGSPAGRRRFLMIGALLLAGAAVGWGIFRYTEKFYGGSEAFLPLFERGAHSYAFLSRHHAAFVGNEIFLLLGGALLLFFLRFMNQEVRARTEDEGRIGRFLGGAALLSLLHLLLVDPYLGSRDWDLMALPVFPCLLWLGHALLGARAGTGEGTAVLIAGAMFLHSFPWIAAQIDRDRAVAMTVAMTIRDPHYANPAARAPKAFGVLLSTAGYSDEAALFFERAASIREDAQNLFNLGTSRARRGDHAEAVRLLSRAIELEPRYAQVYVNLSHSLLRLGEAGRAEEVLRTVLLFAPEYAKAHRALGFVLAEKRLYEEALASFRRAVEIEPSDAESWIRIGILLSGAGSTGEAADALRRALALDPGNLEAKEALRRIEPEDLNRIPAP